MKLDQSSSRKNIRRILINYDRFDVTALAAVFILLALLGGVIAIGDQTSGGQPASRARIVYLGPVGAVVLNLYAVNANGGLPEQLTQSSNGIVDFDVFPDGRIVYTDSNLDTSTNIMIYEPDNHQVHQLFSCENAFCNQVAVNPKGNLIAFERSDFNIGTGMAPGATRLWLYDFATRRVSRLWDDDQKIGYSARWSADGNKLASWDAANDGIVIYNFTTKEEAKIPVYSGQVGRFSPNGQLFWFPHIVQVEKSTPNVDKRLYASHISLSDISKQPFEVRNIEPDAAADDDSDPIWDLNGQSLYVLRRPAEATREQGRQIYRLDIATGKATPVLVDYGYAHSNLTLSPTGDQLLFERVRSVGAGNLPEIWTLDLKTGQTRQVARDGTMPRWLP